MCLCIYRPARRKHCLFYVFSYTFYIVLIHLCILLQNIDASDTNSGGDEQIKAARSLFSPRMQYDEWTPLGRGDPLKNDPTFDYVPPVLERVHYWVPPAARTPDPPRSTTPSSATLTTPTRAVPVIQERFQDLSVTRIRQQYIPIYYQFRPNHHRAPYTILVPPPPGKPHNYSSRPSNSLTSTTAAGNDFWETQLVTVAPSTHTHQNKYQQIDVTPAPSMLHFLLHGELAPSTIPPPTYKPTILHQSSPPEPAITTTTSTLTTLSNPSLTTDPLFSHYKQPVEPLRGPMYLIIQGHSKVKTYGPAKLDKISGIPVQETNEVSDNDDFQNHQNNR